MTTGDAQFTRFLQQEYARLKDENLQMTDEISALRRYIGALREFQETVQQFTPEQDILTLLDKTMECALELLNAEDGSLILVDEESDELVFVLVHGAVRGKLQGHRFARQQGIAGWIVKCGEPVKIENVRDDPRFLPDIDEIFGFETISLVAVPLAARGKVLGVIEVVNKHTGEQFNDDDISLLSILGTLAASALDYAATAPPRK